MTACRLMVLLRLSRDLPKGAVLMPFNIWCNYTYPSIIKTYLTVAEQAEGSVVFLGG